MLYIVEDSLINTTLQVIVMEGQLDVICNTGGVYISLGAEPIGQGGRREVCAQWACIVAYCSTSLQINYYSSSSASIC